MALALEDCMCPICMCIMVEPVTMPCTHTLCYPCFKQNVEEASLTCPMCRTRISNWARRAAKTNTLLNKKLWDEIQTLFPDKVQKRQAGQDDSVDDTDTVYMPIISIAKPGEIRQEYEEQLQRLQAQREAERKKELEASEALIKRLQEEENIKSREQLSIEERDREIASELEKVINEAGSDSPINVLMTESKDRLTRSTSSTSSVSASSSRPPSTIETFIHKMREAEKLKAADQAARNNNSMSPYPYKCFSPSQKTNFATGSMATSSSRSISSGGISVGSSRSCTSSSDLEDSGKVTDCNNILSNHTPSNLSLRISSLGSTYGIEEAIDEESNSEDCCVSDKNKRSSSTLSSDSISQELSHFRPIKACPLTPPRKLPSGKVIEPPLIRTTPRNLNKCEFGSPPRSLSDIDASSPIMQRRLSELEEERKCQVNKLSKSTSTGGPAPADDINFSNTPSQSKAMLKEKHLSVNNDYSKSQNTGSESLPCEVVPQENDFSDMPKLTKCVIPLEPIFDDDSKDFDIAPPPLNEICNIDNIQCNVVITQTKQRKKNKSSSKSETDVIAKINSKELENMNTDHRKSRKLSSKGKKDVYRTITPQKSIRDWVFSSNKSASMDVFKDVINITSAKGDDVDGAIDLADKTPVGKYTGVTDDDVVPACTGDASDSQRKRTKLYPFRKRRKRTYDHSDFIFPDWSPKKAKRKMEQLMCTTDEDESETETDMSESTLKQKSAYNKSVKKRIRSQESDDEIVIKKRKFSNHQAKSNKKEMANSKLKSLKSARMIKSVKRNIPNKLTSVKTIDHYWKTSSKEDIHSDDNPVDNMTSTLPLETDVSFSKETQEMLDRKLAEELAKQFQVEAKMKASFFRTKGSSEEYNFRRRRRQSSMVDV